MDPKQGNRRYIRMVRVSELKQTETDIKNDIKKHLGLRRIFNYPIAAGPLSVPGLPDRVMHYQGEVIYLEVKKPGGKLSAPQEAFSDQCKADGITYLVVRSVHELEDWLRSKVA